jgi:uncharacterized membrane protein YoaK (UPF0700 family)
MTFARRRRLVRTRRTSIGVLLVAIISFIAGMTDAIGLLLAGDFVSFMTGNTTRAALALSGADFHHGILLLGAIITFIAGNSAGAVVGHVADRRIFAVLGAVSGLLAIASALSNHDVALPQFYLIVFAMGVMNAAVEHIEGLPIGLTYVTGALSRFGRGIGHWLMGERQMDWSVQIVPWFGMVAGALFGAMMTRWTGTGALWCASVLTLVVALASLRIPKHLQRRFDYLALRPRRSHRA